MSPIKGMAYKKSGLTCGSTCKSPFLCDIYSMEGLIKDK